MLTQTHARHRHSSHYTFLPPTPISSSEEEIIVRRAEPAVDVPHVEQVEVAAARDSGGRAMAGGGGLVVLVRRRQRAVAAAHLVPAEGAAVRRRDVAGARRGGGPAVRGHGVALRRRHRPVGEDEVLGWLLLLLGLVIERLLLGRQHRG